MKSSIAAQARSCYKPTMLRRAWIHACFALAFLAGQSYAFAHAIQHELNPDAKPAACAICVIGHGAAPLPHIALPRPEIEPAASPTVALPETVAVTPIGLPPPSTGPPSILVQ